MATMASPARRARSSSVPIGDLLEALLHETGYLDALRGRAHDRGAGADREPPGARRGRRASSTPRAPEEDTLDVFLQQIALVADADTRRDDEGLVTLMTLHNAKGLEYPIVFIIGCEEGVFPHSRALDEGGARGGAPALLRRDHPRDARPLPDLRAPARASSARTQLRAAAPLPRRDPGRPHRPRGRAAGARARGARGDVRPWAARRPRGGGSRRGRAPTSGWATTSSTRRSARASSSAVEPGGIVVVRFAADGSRAQADGRVRADHEATLSSMAWRQVIDGKAVAARVRAEVAARSRRSPPSTAAAPGLATILVGDDPRRAVYVGGKQKASRRGRHRAASTTASPADAPQRRGRGAHRSSSTPTRRSAGSCSSCRCPTTSTASS